MLRRRWTAARAVHLSLFQYCFPKTDSHYRYLKRYNCNIYEWDTINYDLKGYPNHIK